MIIEKLDSYAINSRPTNKSTLKLIKAIPRSRSRALRTSNSDIGILAGIVFLFIMTPVMAAMLIIITSKPVIEPK